LYEEQIINDKKRMQNIIDGTNVGTWEWNIQTGEAIFNERWAQIIGYTLAELNPISIKTWQKYSHPDDLKQSDKLLDDYFAGKLSHYEFESRMKHKDGRWIWVIDRGGVISHTIDGKPLMMFGTHSDISERKQAEEDSNNATINIKRINSLMVDRELKMVKLKKEIEELKKFKN